MMQTNPVRQHEGQSETVYYGSEMLASFCRSAQIRKDCELKKKKALAAKQPFGCYTLLTPMNY